MAEISSGNTPEISTKNNTKLNQKWQNVAKKAKKQHFLNNL